MTSDLPVVVGSSHFIIFRMRGVNFFLQVFCCRLDLLRGGSGCGYSRRGLLVILWNGDDRPDWLAWWELFTNSSGQNIALIIIVFIFQVDIVDWNAVNWYGLLGG